MKIETILDAMVMADRRRLYPVHNPKILLYPNAERQYNAFRARILRRAAIYRNYAVANGYREDQAWFWTDEWQDNEHRVDDLIAKGEIHSFDSMDKFLEGLEE